ncbi:ABC transporter ATP-binding protein [Bradyrhizobium sp. SSUT18]|uniref:ABC transporter ATP-binding protein n=1 Tax=Bradyrhizobium sp. SSUT18 TaxID=3040602 RepID=UPI0024499A03|nr:ABC transporter ATP-binding protein [Bradyrhizobium sp. SSUT18]MDH2399959.1 ABC transporter ATP-binding protein [Bradyrhizobium sp. SSUT18]
MTAGILLQARDLAIAVKGENGPVNAVRGLDIEVRRGETLAIVGESGCGKTLTALALAGLLPDNIAISGGTIELLGEDLSGLSPAQWRSMRGKRIAMIFQDPMAALNPVLTIGEQIVEAILAHRAVGKEAARMEAMDLLERVRLPLPDACMRAYPHQLSGGMRQRVTIAIAIANRPEILIADEPTTALDATVHAEILTLLTELKRESGMSLVMITHDLALVSRWADRVVVMYAGKAVESRPAIGGLLTSAAHPYTRALLAARPSRRPRAGPRPRLAEIPGRVPLPHQIGNGCSFADRCNMVLPACRNIAPARLVLGNGEVWCHAATYQTSGGCEVPA